VCSESGLPDDLLLGRLGFIRRLESAQDLCHSKATNPLVHTDFTSRVPRQVRVVLEVKDLLLQGGRDYHLLSAVGGRTAAKDPINVLKERDLPPGVQGPQSIPTNVGPTPYWAHVAETCLKFAVGQFSGWVTMSNVHAALPTEVKRVKTRMYLRPIRGRSRWPRGQRVLCSDWSIAV